MLIVLNIPFALIGGILALLLTDIPLSVSAAIGFIALFGQALLNGVVMVAYFNQLRAAGMPTDEAVLQGSLVRMRTVLMTGLLAMLGLLPMALSHAIGSETQKPLAVVIVFGTLSAFALTMVLLPVLYRWYATVFEPVVGTPRPGPAPEEEGASGARPDPQPGHAPAETRYGADRFARLVGRRCALRSRASASRRSESI